MAFPGSENDYQCSRNSTQLYDESLFPALIMTATTSIQVPTTIVTPEGRSEAQEYVAIETPYTIMLNEVDIGASMVLPVGLEEFGVGFLFGQGYISRPEEVKEVLVCPEGRISVFADVDSMEPKDVIITSGCGGTGKIPREMLEGYIEPPLAYTISFDEVKRFIREVLQSSVLGPMTHCVHGCGLWADGGLQVFYEDVGRHNAVDKVMGAILLGKASPRSAVYTTGRLDLRHGTEMCPDEDSHSHVTHRAILTRPGHRRTGGVDTRGLCQARTVEYPARSRTNLS